MKKLLVVALLLNAVLLAGRFWQELPLKAQGKLAGQKSCDPNTGGDPTLWSVDGNNDGLVDISDAVYLLQWLFRGGAEPQRCYADKLLCDRCVDTFVVRGEPASVTPDMIDQRPNSGLDSDTLDGLHGDDFARADHAHLGNEIADRSIPEDRLDFDTATQEELDAAVADLSGRVPAGVVVMWSGAVSEIPPAWHLCDGTNGTPDLRDRFVLGAIDELDAGEIGGTHSYSLTRDQLPPHAHTGTTADAGAHTHSHIDSYWLGGDIGPTWYGSNAVPHSGNINRETESGGVHSHTFTTDSTGQGEAIDNKPAYYRLAFIMKLPAPATRYLEEFANDPEWVTDQPGSFGWNQAQETFQFVCENAAPADGHQPNRYAYYEVGVDLDSWLLEWDQKLARIDVSAGVGFGAYDRSLKHEAPLPGNGIEVRASRDELGNAISLWVYADDAENSASSARGVFEEGVWYSFTLTYDKEASSVALSVRHRPSGVQVFVAALDAPGPFSAFLSRVGLSRNGVCSPDCSSPEAIAVGEIDNVLFEPNPRS